MRVSSFYTFICLCLNPSGYAQCGRRDNGLANQVRVRQTPYTHFAACRIWRAELCSVTEWLSITLPTISYPHPVPISSTHRQRGRYCHWANDIYTVEICILRLVRCKWLRSYGGRLSSLSRACCSASEAAIGGDRSIRLNIDWDSPIGWIGLSPGMVWFG